MAVEQFEPWEKSPHQPAIKAVVDREHPEAGRGGVVPPEATRFQPGNNANPGGRPRGCDPRAVLRRKWAENPNEHGEGQKAVEHAERIEQAMLDRDLMALDAEQRVLHEISGKPQEFREVSGVEKTIVIHAPFKGEPPEPPAETDSP